MQFAMNKFGHKILGFQYEINTKNGSQIWWNIYKLVNVDEQTMNFILDINLMLVL